jgi:hypothetical protein
VRSSVDGVVGHPQPARGHRLGGQFADLLVHHRHLSLAEQLDFCGFASTPSTVWPREAKQAAETHPT